MPGLLIISILNGLFKTGHVKVRDSEINHADSSFPRVELVAALVDHCRSAQFRRLASNKCMDAAALDLGNRPSSLNFSPSFRHMCLIEQNEPARTEEGPDWTA